MGSLNEAEDRTRYRGYRSERAGGSGAGRILSVRYDFTWIKPLFESFGSWSSKDG